MGGVYRSCHVHVVVPVRLEDHVEVPEEIKVVKEGGILSHLVRFQCSTRSWKVVSASCNG